MEDQEVIKTEVHIVQRGEDDRVTRAWCRWELMDSRGSSWTRRIQVQGGWIVETGGPSIGLTSTFIPDPCHEWELVYSDHTDEPAGEEEPEQAPDIEVAEVFEEEAPPAEPDSAGIEDAEFKVTEPEKPIEEELLATQEELDELPENWAELEYPIRRLRLNKLRNAKAREASRAAAAAATPGQPTPEAGEWPTTGDAPAAAGSPPTA